jgi:hypothetical protein
MPRGWAAPQVTYARWVECPCPFARAAAHNESRKVWCLFLSGRPAATANFRSPTSSSRSAIRASVRAAYIQRKTVRRASPSVAHDKSRRRFSRGNCHPSQQHPEESRAVVSVDMGQRSFDVKHGANYSRRGSRPVCQPGHPLATVATLGDREAFRDCQSADEGSAGDRGTPEGGSRHSADPSTRERLQAWWSRRSDCIGGEQRVDHPRDGIAGEFLDGAARRAHGPTIQCGDEPRAETCRNVLNTPEHLSRRLPANDEQVLAALTSMWDKSDDRNPSSRWVIRGKSDTGRGCNECGIKSTLFALDLPTRPIGA